mmetsp:Transcript_38682/g.37031  ORF Transcript_38682/g.37031 Transcript_38682/m.37031 type:complete len:86 (+) Transcript_38682:21-278(+)
MNAENLLFDNSLPLVSFETGLIGVGCHEFDFELEIPTWVPSSFLLYTQKNRNKGRILYSIKVSLEDNSSEKKKLPSLKAKKRIIV